MKFSLILPTRNNIEGLKKMFKSIEDTAFYLPNVEVLLAVDLDDPQYEEIKNIETKVNFQTYRREQSTYFPRDYYNWLALMCDGDAIQAFNDDACYETPCWDEIIAKKVKGKDIWFADIHDTTRPHYPCFPMVSRKAYERLGFILHPQIHNWPSDGKIYEVYDKAGVIVNCHDVKIKHDRVVENKKHFEKLADQDLHSGNLNIDIDADVDRLLDRVEA